VPIEEEDVVHILKRRLFKEIDSKVAERIASAYYETYQELPVPDELKSKSYIDMMRDYYPLHPHLIKVLYERVATLDRFQRTRGALRLLVRVVRRIWAEKENDATLIHPFHVDLADPDILTDLSTHIGEEKLRNAVEANVWKGDGTAVAERLDDQAKENWGAPLIRRACNIIYLYSLATGKEGDRGIRSELLTSLMVTPMRKDYFLKVRDIVLDYLSEHFHFIDRIGDRFVFVREPTPIRVIDLLARDITEDETLKVVKDKLQQELFKRTPSSPDWIDVEFFPTSPSKLLDDETVIQVGILNPNVYVMSDRSVPEPVKKFLEYRDDHAQHPRMFSNSTFLLVTAEDRLEPMKLAGRKVVAARMVSEDFLRYGIPKDRKSDVEEYRARQEKNMHDYMRTAFSNLVYYDAQGVKAMTIRDGSGYGSAASGYDLLKHMLVSVLNRVKDEPLDPEYVNSRVWPAGAVSVSIKTLYEQFHRRPGVIIPSTKEKFLETIRKGVENGFWVLKHKDKVYTKDRLPKAITIEDYAELFVYEEAEKLGMLKTVPIVEGPKGPTDIGPTPSSPVTPTVIELSESTVEALAGDIDKKAVRDRFTRVHGLTLRTLSQDPRYILEMKNILVRLAPEKTCSVKLTGTMSRAREPYYTVSFEVSKEDAQKDEGKSLLDNIWKLKGTESLDIHLEIKWTEPVKPEEAARILRSMSRDIVASLEASVGA